MGALPRFDPAPSLQHAQSILVAVGAPHALIGGVALWAYLPPAAQRLTKDVDVAVPHAWMSKIEGEIRRRGLNMRPLTIGGLGVRDERCTLDFIDRSPDFESLYDAAIDEAQQKGRMISTEDIDFPIVSVEYLVVMKLATAETTDERDIEHLLREEDSGRSCRSSTAGH